SYQAYAEPHLIRLANKSSIEALGEGNVALSAVVDGKRIPIQLKSVLHVPALANSLLSVRTATRRGHAVNFSLDRCSILNPSGKIIAQSKGRGNLYDLHVVP
ncbi:uncharacterized protein EI90DRAFT_2841981, partial [Cantharellus anzutake]|uniref:uncharacterized protein n=1 Tax=Cantharellus anzutake TaxID=1750568 RepID=UPI0019077204